MTTTFEDVKVGDQMWSVEFGWGEVVSRDIVSECFTVEFSSDEFETYCFKGARKRPLREKMQTLFWDEVVIEAPTKPLPELEVDAKVLVWNDPKQKHKRHFSHFRDGVIWTFDAGHTSFTRLHKNSMTHWLYWELAE